MFKIFLNVCLKLLKSCNIILKCPKHLLKFYLINTDFTLYMALYGTRTEWYANIHGMLWYTEKKV